MKCGEAARLVHRAAGGDLDSLRRSRLAEHVAACAPCAALERELAETLVDVRAALSEPFTLEERAAIREDVRRAVEKARRVEASRGANRAPARSLPWAAAVTAALLVAVALEKRDRASSRGTDRVTPATSSRAEPSSAAPAVDPVRVQPQPQPPAPAPPPAETTGRVARAKRPHPPGLRSGAGGVARVELTTRDPNVRIIWLFRDGAGSPPPARTRQTEEVS